MKLSSIIAPSRVQSATPKMPASDKAAQVGGQCFTEFFSLEYIDKPSFDGAVPDALESAIENLESFVLDEIGGLSLPVTDPKAPPLYVMHRFDAWTWEEYVRFLTLMRAGKHSLQHPTLFDLEFAYQGVLPDKDYSSKVREARKTVWWDLDNDVFFSFKRSFVRAIPALLRESHEVILGKKPKSEVPSYDEGED